MESTTGGPLLNFPTVSVIVTNYNYQQYLIESLRSILLQTYKPIECIVVDDASTDDSIATIKEFIDTSEGTSHFQLVQCSQNSGQMNAFVEGFRRSSGQFVVFVDADDYLFPEFIAIHVAAHLNGKFVAAVTSSNEVIIDGEGRLIASTIEKWHRRKTPTFRLSQEIPVKAQLVDTWDPQSVMSGQLEPVRPPFDLLYVRPDGNDVFEFLWSTTSATMFRRGALEVALNDEVRDIRISADYFLLHYCHLLGGSLILQTAHGAYRRHGGNNFATAPPIGRGTRTWRPHEGWDRDNALKRLRQVIVDDARSLVDLVGEPRMVQLLATIVPLHRSRSVFDVLRRRDLQLQYIVLRPLKVLKRAWLKLLQYSQIV